MQKPKEVSIEDLWSKLYTSEAKDIRKKTQPVQPKENKKEEGKKVEDKKATIAAPDATEISGVPEVSKRQTSQMKVEMSEEKVATQL